MKQKKTIKFSFQGKKYSIKDYNICDNVFSKARGLMFRSKDFKTPLVFLWKKPGIYPIHSFFCRKFLAIWFRKGRIIDEKVVEPWRVSVTPKEKFDELLEIPLNYDETRNI
jgi:uncharacterized membrane protein (UPF0127 family)